MGFMWKMLILEVPIRAIECRSVQSSSLDLDPKITMIERKHVKARPKAQMLRNSGKPYARVCSSAPIVRSSACVRPSSELKL